MTYPDAPAQPVFIPVGCCETCGGCANRSQPDAEVSGFAGDATCLSLNTTIPFLFSDTCTWAWRLGDPGAIDGLEIDISTDGDPTNNFSGQLTSGGDTSVDSSNTLSCVDGVVTGTISFPNPNPNCDATTITITLG